MIFSFDNWFLFPVSILVATTAMSTGIGGAVFFSPIFMLGLKLEPAVAIGTALVTELFGFSSGLVAYKKAQLIDFKLGKEILMLSIPGAFIGVYVSDLFPSSILKAIFAVGIIFIGVQIFTSWRQEQKEKLDQEIEQASQKGNHTSSLTDARGRKFDYTVCNKPMGAVFAAFGGTFLGMISVGLAELMEYHLVAKCRVPSPVAVATSIFVVVVTVFVASVSHVIGFFEAGRETVFQAINVAMFTVPGVLIGGQIGPRVQAKVDPDKMKIVIASIFFIVGFMMLYTLTA